jgi:hypothetical protein
MHTFQVAMLVGSSLADREPEVLATVEAVDHRDAMRAFFASSLHPRIVTQRQVRAAMVGDNGTNQDSNHGLHYTVDGVEYVVTDMDIVTTERRPAAMHEMPDGELTPNPDAELVYCDAHAGEHVAQPGCREAAPSSPEPIHAHPLMPAEPVRAHLDPLAAAKHLADMVSQYLDGNELGDRMAMRAALADYREACR